MPFKCQKCNNTFISNTNLNKHLNRQTPCNEIIQCKRCDKLFKQSKELTNHMNRKFPCKIIDNNAEYEDREKDRQLKLLLSRDKLAIKEQEMAIKQQEIQAREIISLREVNAQMAALQAQKDMLQMTIDSRENTENIKTLRKEQTVTLINNNIITNNTINNNITFVTHIENNYFNSSNICYTQITDKRIKVFDKLCHHWDDEVTIKGERNIFINMFLRCKTTRELLYTILMKSYNDPQNNIMPSIFYSKICNLYYGIQINNEKKILRVLDYNKDLYSEIIDTVQQYAEKFILHVNYLKIDDLDDPNHYNIFNRYNEIKAYKRNLYILPSIVQEVYSVESE